MEPSRTKFYLDSRNGKWMGVCSGIADYTGIDVVWVRVATVIFTIMGGFPWTLIAYWLVGWLAQDRPQGLYVTAEEQKFWQGVRANPTRSARAVRASFRDLDRRLADIELLYTSRNKRLSDEIESLR